MDMGGEDDPIAERSRQRGRHCDRDVRVRKGRRERAAAREEDGPPTLCLLDALDRDRHVVDLGPDLAVDLAGDLRVRLEELL